MCTNSTYALALQAIRILHKALTFPGLAANKMIRLRPGETKRHCSKQWMHVKMVVNAAKLAISSFVLRFKVVDENDVNLESNKRLISTAHHFARNLLTFGACRPPDRAE